jgi:hypothetical protein
MLKTIVGMFADTSDARRAAFELELARFPLSTVSVAMREGAESAFGSGGSLLDLPISNQARTAPMEAGQTKAEAMYTGDVEDFGPIIAAGPLAQAIGGAALGRAAGGLTGALTNIGIPNETARTLTTQVRTGERTLLAIKVPPEDSDRVGGLLLENGAAEVYVSRDHKRAEGDGERSIEQVQVGF